MLSHDFAQQLLALPNLPLDLSGTGERVVELPAIDHTHPDYIRFDQWFNDDRTEWWNAMPKRQVIGFTD